MVARDIIRALQRMTTQEFLEFASIVDEARNVRSKELANHPFLRPGPDARSLQGSTGRSSVDPVSDIDREIANRKHRAMTELI